MKPKRIGVGKRHSSEDEADKILADAESSAVLANEEQQGAQEQHTSDVVAHDELHALERLEHSEETGATEIANDGDHSQQHQEEEHSAAVLAGMTPSAEEGLRAEDQEESLPGIRNPVTEVSGPTPPLSASRKINSGKPGVFFGSGGFGPITIDPSFNPESHTEFNEWLSSYIEKHPKSTVVREDKYNEIAHYLKNHGGDKKGVKNQFGTAPFRFWVRRQGFEYRKKAPRGPTGATDDEEGDGRGQDGTEGEVDDFYLTKTSVDEGEKLIKTVVKQDQIAGVLWTVHWANGSHIGTDRTRQVVTKTFYGIPDDVIRQFVKLCKCQKDRRSLFRTPSKATKKTEFWNSLQIEYVDFSELPSEGKLFILLVQEKKSKFCLLTALPSIDTKAVAEALSQVFHTFGPATTLDSHKFNEADLNRVCLRLAPKWPKLRVKSSLHGGDAEGTDTEGVGSNSPSDTELLLETVRKNAVTTMVEKGTKDWTSILAEVQWNMNTTVQPKARSSAYTSLFGIAPKSQEFQTSAGSGAISGESFQSPAEELEDIGSAAKRARTQSTVDV